MLFIHPFTRTLVLLLSLTGQLFAQVPSPSFEHYSTEAGLSSEQVTSVLKDRRGFMWFGTVNGLNRFDGRQFVVFKRKDKPGSLPGNYVVNEGLAEDPNGFLWVSTNRGLCRYDPGTGNFQTLLLPEQRDQFADNDFVSPVRFDRSGQAWFTSVNRLYRFRPLPGPQLAENLTEFPLPHIVTSAYAIPFPDRANRIWVQQTGAVYRFDPSTRQYSYFLGEDAQHREVPLRVEALTEDRDGKLYALTGQRGLFRYDAKVDRFVDEPDRAASIRTLAHERLPNGKSLFWLGGYGRLTAYAPAENRFTDFKHVPDDPLSFPGGVVGASLLDPSTGILWLGTSKGVVKVDPSAIKFSRKRLPDHQNGEVGDVRSVQQDYRDDGRYWVLTDRVLYVWDRLADRFQEIPAHPALAGRHQYDFVQDRQGRLWVGMRGGVGIYDPARKRWEVPGDLDTKPATGEVSIQALCVGPDGRVWLGTFDHGLLFQDPVTDRVQSWPLPNATRIRRLQPDPSGQIWVLTDIGLFCLNPATGQTRRITLRGAPTAVQPSDRLQSTFLVDRRGELWVSGIDFLVRADTTGRVRQTFTLANGLRADHVISLIEDRRGRLWLGTDEQLHELNPATGQFRYFNKTNGLFANTQYNMLTMDRTGELFVGYPQAFNHWQPERLRQNSVPPPVVVTAVRVNGKPRPLTQPLELQPDENTLAVDFAALNYSQPEKNQYAYRLEGFNEAWTYPDVPSATYTNLEPGSYTLRIRAANNDGVWNDSGTSLSIRVIPAYYQTSWFRVLVGLVLAGMAYGLYRYRVAQRRRLERVRDRIAKDLHDDMGSTLSSIRVFSDVVQAQVAPVRPEAVPLLQRISSNATTLSESMQDIIWTIQTKHDGLSDLVARMREFGLRLTEARGIAFRLDVPDSFPATRLNVEQRRNLYLIFKESLNNAVKYAEASRINVRLSLEGKNLRFTMQDDGIGFDPSTARAGNGLTNLRQRAADLRGQLTLSSAPGQGTTVDVTARL